MKKIILAAALVTTITTGILAAVSKSNSLKPVQTTRTYAIPGKNIFANAD